MTVTLGGIPVLDGWLRIPSEGCACGSVELDRSPAAGPLLLRDDRGNTVAVAASGRYYAGRWRGQVTGGPTLGRVIGPSGYRSATVGVVLASVCSAGLAVPSRSIRPSVSGLALAHWQRAAGTLGGALRDLATRAGAKWRILRDGSVWLGTGLPEPRLAAWKLPTVLDYSEGLRLLTVEGGILSIDPGDSVEDWTVSAVRYSLGPERVTEVWLDR